MTFNETLKIAKKYGYEVSVNFMSSLPYCLYKSGLSHHFKEPYEIETFFKLLEREGDIRPA